MFEDWFALGSLAYLSHPVTSAVAMTRRTGMRLSIFTPPRTRSLKATIRRRQQMLQARVTD
jgi:hypothetical protein